MLSAWCSLCNQCCGAMEERKRYQATAIRCVSGLVYGNTTGLLILHYIIACNILHGTETISRKRARFITFLAYINTLISNALYRHMCTARVDARTAEIRTGPRHDVQGEAPHTRPGESRLYQVPTAQLCL